MNFSPGSATRSAGASPTASQRAIAAAEACELFTPNGLSASMRKRVARDFGTNEKYLANARALVERDPDAAGSVKAGAQSLDDAYRSALREPLFPNR